LSLIAETDGPRDQTPCDGRSDESETTLTTVAKENQPTDARATLTTDGWDEEAARDLE
jgi:hypothetical protein